MPLGLPHFSAVNIIGNLLFSSIGYVAYSYGKKMGNIRVMVQGGVLMGYSYIVSETVWMYAIGIVLTAWVWFTRNDG
jgi:hypothetical protein